MKHFNIKKLFTVTAVLLCSMVANAHNFEVGGIYYNITNATNKTVAVTYKGDHPDRYSNEYTGNVVIPESVTYSGTVYSVTSIGYNAFEDCSNLASVVIGNSVTTIGESAFYNCSNLASVVIGNSVTSIGDYAFSGCGIEKMIWFPPTRPSCDYYYNSSIGSAGIHYVPNNNYSFSNSVVLTNLSAMFEIDNIRYIPLDLKERTCIAVDYMGEENVSTVVINDVVTYNNKLSLTVKEVMPYCFYNKKNITDITIPNSVTSIGKYAFYGCSALANVGISNNAGITKFGNNAFEGCMSLTSIVIPNEVTSIEANAFKGCFGITSIESYATTPPTCGTNALYDIDKLNCTLYVPENCIEAYSNANQWSNFIFIENFATATEEYTVTFMVDGEVYKTVTVAYGAEIPTVETPTKEGYIFSGWSETPATMPAEDITITGYFTLSPDVELEKCATPIISYNNGKLETECETEGAEFVISITSEDINNFYSSSVDLSATYNISVYAMLEGFENSDIATATLCWVENGGSDEDDTTNIITVPAVSVLVTSANGAVAVSCSLEGETVAVYTTDGTLVGSAAITNGSATIQSGLSNGSVAIVKIGNKSVKVVVD